MNNLKRILSVFLICIIGITSAVFSAEVPEDTKEYVSETGILFELDILTADKYGNYAPKTNLTRAEMCHTVAKMINADISSVAESPFYDVTAETDFAGAICALYNLGYISGNGSGYFNPGEYATAAEAIKLMVSVLGYAEPANYNGGYPHGYMSVAKRIGILSGVNVNADTLLTKGEFAFMVANAVEVNLYDITSITYEGEYEKVTVDETLLSRYYGVYKITDCVNANKYTGIADMKATGDGHVNIGGKILKTGETDITNYLGYFVSAYYDHETDVILSFKTDKRNTVVEISGELSPYYKNGNVYYFNDISETKILNKKISSKANIVYNNKLIKNLSEEYFDVKEGSILLIDGNSDGTYETVIIKKFETYAVRYMDLNSNTLYFKNKGVSPIDLNKTEFEIFDNNGNQIDTSYIKEWNILSCMFCEDKSLVTIYRSNNVLSGVVTGIMDSDKIEMENGQQYEVISTFKNDYKIPDIGENRVFYLDIFGNIAAVKSVQNEDIMLGYITDFKKENLSEAIKVRLLVEEPISTDSEGKFLSANLAKNIEVDGVNVKRENFQSLIEKNKTDGIDSLIAFKLNSSEEIYYVDTPSLGENEDIETTLLLNYVPTSSLKFRREGRTFGGRALLSPSVQVFYVPGVDEEKIGENYDVLGIASLGNDKAHPAIYKTYKFGLYSVSDCAVIYNKSIGASGENGDFDRYMKISIIEKITEVYNEETEEVETLVSGYTGNNKFSAYVEDEEVLPGYGEGDAVKVSYNTEGEINALRHLFDASANSLVGVIDGEMYNNSNFDYEARCVYGYVYRIKDGAMLITKYAPDQMKAKIDELKAKGYSGNQLEQQIALLCEKHLIPSTVWVWDNVKKTKITQGSTRDIYSYEEYEEDCSKVFIYSIYSNAQTMYIYKNMI